MEKFSTVQLAILILSLAFLIIIIIYLIANCYGKSVIVSTLHKNGDEIEADMVYYLPTASLLVNAAAKVTVEKDSSGVIKSAHLAEMVLENTVSIIPDTNFLFVLKYKPNIFMNDEVHFTTGTTGLLDTVRTTTDDQLTDIIKQFANAPAQILAVKSAVLGIPVVAPINTITMPYTKTFHIRPDEILAEDATCPWIINIDGGASVETKVNASFKMSFTRQTTLKDKKTVKPTKEGCLFTRPLTTLIVKITLLDNSASESTESELQIIVPDNTRIINIPVKRSSLVKRVNAPKFNSGLIMENYINMPSQFEGAVSIPINIAKALVSIPSALFNFTIHRKYDDQLASLGLKKKLLDAQIELKKLTDPADLKKPGT